MDIEIRLAREDDAEELLNIYAYYVKQTAITFEHEVPTLEEFTGRIKDTLQNYPYLVALVNGTIAGYSYAGKFKARASYLWSASTSIYIDRQFHRMGIGRMLYEKLEAVLAKQNVVNLYAGIASPIEEDEYLTHSSEQFHRSIGYQSVAEYHKCGNKFGQWYNVIEMEKIIGRHTYPPHRFIPFREFTSELSIQLQDEEWSFEYTDHDREIVRAIVFDDSGYFYFVRAERNDEFGQAVLIETSGGGVERGEDLHAAIRRELKEELGAEVDILHKIGVVSDYYNLIHRHNINNYYLCKIVSFGEKNLTQDELECFHLSTLKLTYEEALKEYETRAATKLGRLLFKRELPVLRQAKNILDLLHLLAQ